MTTYAEQLAHLNDQHAAAQDKYHEAMARLSEARATIHAMQTERDTLRNDANTKPATLTKLLMDLQAREMLLPALDAEMLRAHQVMRGFVDAIAQLDNQRNARAAQLENMQRQHAALERELNDRQHQINVARDAAQRQLDEVAALRVWLGMNEAQPA